MTKLQPARGTRDIWGEDLRRFRKVTETARQVSETFGFSEWMTPIFEDSRVFTRTLGDTSDVVTKEMYSFADRGGDSLTLRPENTAGVCRALVSNGLTQSLPQKVFYAGPMFRYERPQKGRYRQFHQIGLELLGPDTSFADAELIACGFEILKALGLKDHITLELNTLGDTESREAYRNALVDYFSGVKDRLSEESQMRLLRNPLRILDSKEEQDKEFCAAAPVGSDYLSEKARRFFEEVQSYLHLLGVPFKINSRIVRGLDYYSHTAFEFVTDALGAQGTVMAGGRYENLVTEMGGPQVSAVGFAAGVERLALLLKEVPSVSASVYVIFTGEATEAPAIRFLSMLRAKGIKAEMSYKKSVKKQMEQADKQQAKAVILFGDEEWQRGRVIYRSLSTGIQEEKTPEALLNELAGEKHTYEA